MWARVRGDWTWFFSPLSSLSADDYKVFLEQREEKLKADAEAAAAAAAEALSGKKKWRIQRPGYLMPQPCFYLLYTWTALIKKCYASLILINCLHVIFFSPCPYFHLIVKHFLVFRITRVCSWLSQKLWASSTCGYQQHKASDCDNLGRNSTSLHIVSSAERYLKVKSKSLKRHFLPFIYFKI